MTTKFRALVAYATKHGATAEIAEEIGRVLRGAGLHADVLPVESVSDLAPYSAVVLGSAVYAGQWRKEAADFLAANEAPLAQMPLWVFSSGPTGAGDPVELVKGWTLPEGLVALVNRIQPRAVVLFHGDLEIEELNLVEKMIVKGVKAPLGDFRDWEVITRWAEAIAAALVEIAPAEPALLSA
jgi:menaquinone-dependent protoporphyrinogen oxidase